MIDLRLMCWFQSIQRPQQRQDQDCQNHADQDQWNPDPEIVSEGVEAAHRGGAAA